MSVLTGAAIREAVEAGTIIINPFDRASVNPNSVNLHLHNELLEYDSTQHFDWFEKPPQPRHIVIPEVGWTLLPGFFYLGRTVEWVELYNHQGQLDGRSGGARLSLLVHQCGGFI